MILGRRIAVAWGLIFWMGCATGGDPPERALAQSSAVVSDGVDAAITALDSQDSLILRGRYNPCRCPAPDFELHVHGHWTRVILRGDTTSLEALQVQAEELDAAPHLVYFRMTGQFDGSARFDATNAEYEVFEVLDFGVE